jgi:hypothetical protein
LFGTANFASIGFKNDGMTTKVLQSFDVDLAPIRQESLKEFVSTDAGAGPMGFGD